MTRRTVIILFFVTIILHGWAVWRCFSADNEKPAAFIDVPPTRADRAPPCMSEGYISPDAGQGMVHVPSICELSDGRLAAVWYGGTREGARDTAIYYATNISENTLTWCQPRVIVDRASASKELCRFVKKVGNPVLFTDSEDNIWLIYVSISVGGWSGSSLNVKISYDNGNTWTRSERLVLSPFLNIGELVRNTPVIMSNHRFLVPIYHECIGRFPEILWIWKGRKTRRIYFKKTRMSGGRSYIQPSVVGHDSRLASAFYRNMSGDRSIGMAVSSDAGITWSEPQNLELPNPDSGLNAILLSGGRILLAFNDSNSNRHNLSLAVSSDAGRHFMRIAVVEDTAAEEFSYPYMIRDREGKIHLVYTWRRKRIKHVVFNEPWIDAEIKKASNS